MLKETVEMLSKLKKDNPEIKATTYLSNAGKEVVEYYSLQDELKKISPGQSYEEIIEESRQGSSYFITGRLFKGNYDIVLVSPMTANTVAKVAYGIADSLVSCAVAMACKSKTKVVVLPTDTQKEYNTEIPSTSREKDDLWKMTAYSRKIDLENIEKLRKMEDIIVIEHPDEFLKQIK